MGVQKEFFELLKVSFNSLGNALWIEWQDDRSGHRVTVFPPLGVMVVCPFSWNVKQASWLPPLPQTLWIQCDIMSSVPSSSDCFVRPWMWPLFHSFVDISLSLGGISLSSPNTWQDVAITFGNIQIPQSLTLGASAAIQRAYQWWTRSWTLPGHSHSTLKCVFC